jgi:hypothetical protein
MEHSIFKYKIEPDFLVQQIELPKGAKVLSFGVDGNDQLCFWADVNSQAPKEKHRVACVGTGWDISALFKVEQMRFIGTVTHGVYVWHLFDLGAVEDRVEGSDAHVEKNEVNGGIEE